MQQPIIKCAFCKGTGHHPHFRGTCPVCKGTGHNHITGKYMTCRDCRGSGQKRGTTLTCYTCAGSGVVPDAREELKEAKQEIRKARAELEEERAQFTHRKATRRPTSTQKGECRGRSPLPEREVSSLPPFPQSGPQALQKNDEWMSGQAPLEYFGKLKGGSL
jgi:RecJ-like exonuclease